MKYWEIGNEMWGPWQIGHCSAEEFAERHLAYAKAIKEVYPEAILLACGHRIMDWNIPIGEVRRHHRLPNAPHLPRIL